MFVFIAGVQPRRVTLDRPTRTCPSCGNPRAIVQRTDHYFSFFFIPLFPVKKGSPVLACDRCGAVHDQRDTVGEPPRGSAVPMSCAACGRRLQPGFLFCPACGKAVEVDEAIFRRRNLQR